MCVIECPLALYRLTGPFLLFHLDVAAAPDKGGWRDGNPTLECLKEPDLRIEQRELLFRIVVVCLEVRLRLYRRIGAPPALSRFRNTSSSDPP
jgi:hypothetical protein